MKNQDDDLRAEIAEADQKTRVFEDLDGEDGILTADELELSAHDAAAKAESESPADSEENADDTDGDAEPPEEGRENNVVPMVELIACGSISTAAINIRGQCMARFSVTSEEKIKVGRSEVRSCNLEAGE